MFRMMMKSKLHRARVTECNLQYEGSISIDSNLMEMADLLPNEQVQVVNVNTGARFETYVIPGTAGTGTFGLNGGAARLAQPGDVILVISYAFIENGEAPDHEPRVILLDERNEPIAR